MSSNSSPKKALLGQVASVEIEQKRDDPVEADTRLDIPTSREPTLEDIVAEMAANSTDEVAATTADGQRLDYRMNPRTDSRGAAQKHDNDAMWASMQADCQSDRRVQYDLEREEFVEVPGPMPRDDTRSVGPDRRPGETLEQQERRKGREQEMESITKRARAAAEADIERGASNRVQNALESDWRGRSDVQTLVGENGDETAQTDDPEGDDPRAGMEAETLAAVNQAATEVSEAVAGALSVDRPALSRLLAEMVVDGRDVSAAKRAVRAALRTVAGAALVEEPTTDGSTKYSHPDEAWPTVTDIRAAFVQPAQVRADVDDEADPRAEMDAATLAAVNQAGRKLAEYFGDEVPRGQAGFARQVAEMVADGGDVVSAYEQIKEAVYSTITVDSATVDHADDRLRRVRRAGRDVSKWDYEVTVEGEVVSLFEHPAESQHQAGFIKTDDGTRLKVTYWQKSKKAFGMPDLKVGDRVRIDRAKVSEWKGEASLAVTGNTDIIHLDHGDGPRPRHGTSSGEVELPAWSAESDKNAWIEQQSGGPDYPRQIILPDPVGSTLLHGVAPEAIEFVLDATAAVEERSAEGSHGAERGASAGATVAEEESAISPGPEGEQSEADWREVAFPNAGVDQSKCLICGDLFESYGRLQTHVEQDHAD